MSLINDDKLDEWKSGFKLQTLHWHVERTTSVKILYLSKSLEQLIHLIQGLRKDTFIVGS